MAGYGLLAGLSINPPGNISEFFRRMLFFFQHKLFSKNSLRSMYNGSISLDPDQAGLFLFGAIWIQTVFKHHQQTTVAGLLSHWYLLFMCVLIYMYQ